MLGSLTTSVSIRFLAHKGVQAVRRTRRHEMQIRQETAPVFGGRALAPGAPVSTDVCSTSRNARHRIALASIGNQWSLEGLPISTCYRRPQKWTTSRWLRVLCTYTPSARERPAQAGAARATRHKESRSEGKSNGERVVEVGISDTSAGGGIGFNNQFSGFYTDMESRLMARMHTRDKNRFRAGGIVGLLLAVWIMSVFGGELRRLFATQTAEVAKETLKVEALQVQTQELATALVQTLLNDQEVVGAGAKFLREASGDSATQAALVSLALYVLQHPDTLFETIILGKTLVQSILDDPRSVEQVTNLALKVVADVRFKQGAVNLVVELGQSPEVRVPRAFDRIIGLCSLETETGSPG